MRTYPATGISLTVRKYRGTRRIVVFYTRECGKVDAVARGIGKPGSKLASVVEPLTLSKVFFAKGRRLDHLTEGEVIDSFYDLRRELRRFAYASYGGELVAGATEPGLPMPRLFDALREMLEALAGGGPPEITLWGFALRLMEQLGVGPALEQCAVCGEPFGGQTYYSPAAGGLICADCRSPDDPGWALSSATVALLRSLATFPIDRLSRLSCTPQSRAQIAQVIRQHLAYYLDFTPRSERFLREIEATSTISPDDESRRQ